MTFRPKIIEDAGRWQVNEVSECCQRICNFKNDRYRCLSMQVPYTHQRTNSPYWQFSLPIPIDLRALYNGKSQIRFSLQNEDRHEAELLASEYRTKYLRQFKEHRECYSYTSEGILQFATGVGVFSGNMDTEPHSYSTHLKKPIQAKSIPAIEEIRTQRQHEIHKLSITNIAYHLKWHS